MVKVKTILKTEENAYMGKDKITFQDQDNRVIYTFRKVEDFENRAAKIEEENEVETPMYDRTKFRKALRHIFEHHDCNNGITWSDVDYCLDAFCRLPLPITEAIQP